MDAGRVFYDISFTRTQSGTVGISRTVRRLFAELERLGLQPVPVAFHSSGFRRVAPAEVTLVSAAAPQGRLLRIVTSPPVRRVVSLTLRVPWTLLSRAWGMASTRVFNSMTQGADSVTFGPGDTLLLCDASWNYPAWVPAQRAREQGAKVLVLIYDLIPLRHPEFCYRLTTLIFGDWLTRMLKRCDAAICISDATRKDVMKWASQQPGLRPPALGYFHLGSDLDGSVDASPRLREFFSVGAPSFVSVGSIEPRKNHAQLLDVFERLWASGSPVRLLVAGKPTIDCAELVQRLRAHPEYGARLLVLSDASDGEIRYAYGECSAMVFPSLAEGFGLPIVEARACGCRVIASDLAVFREFADEGVRFFKAGSASALEEALREEMRSPPSGPTARTELLSWAASGAQFVHVMTRLLAA